jgi:FixJ family two-component response regulator
MDVQKSKKQELVERARRPAAKTRQNFTIDADLLDRFRKYCTKEKLVMSTIVEDQIRDFLGGK